MLLDGVQPRRRRFRPEWFRKHGNDFDVFEGHGELIALDHDNLDVVDTVDVMTHWLRRGADGGAWTPPTAVPDRFWAQPHQGGSSPRTRGSSARSFTATTPRGAEPGFDRTQYELWKAIWSSLNDGNFHELDWALVRHNEFLDNFVPMTSSATTTSPASPANWTTPVTSNTRW